MPVRRLLARRFLPGVLAVAAGVTWIPVHGLDDDTRVIDREHAHQDWVWKGKTPLELDVSIASSESAFRCVTHKVSSALPRPFVCDRIWILNRTPVRLAHEIGRGLQVALLQTPGLYEVAYFGAGDQPLAVMRPPDLFVTVELDDFEVLALPGYLRAAADVVFTASRRGFSTSSGVHEEPGVRAIVEIEERSWGLVSSAARYDRLVAAACDGFDLGEWIVECSERWGRAPSTPLDWIDDAGDPPDDLPFEIATDRDRLYSQANFLVNDESAWCSPIGERPWADMLQTASDALERDGWSLEGEPGDPTVTLRARRGERTVAAWVQRLGAAQDPPGRGRLVVLHRAEMSELAARERLESLLSAGAEPGRLAEEVERLPEERRDALSEALR